MSSAADSKSLPVTDMLLIHNIHRAATSLLAQCAQRPDDAPAAELTELRDFVVTALHHHHESEDTMLWPLLEQIDPEAAAGLAELTGEHHSLDAALDALAAAEIGAAGAADAAQTELADAAVAVRDLIARHLDHEESLTFSGMRQLTEAQWAEFSRVVMETTPPSIASLQIGLMEEVGDPAEVAAVLAGLPAPAAEALPFLRKQAAATLGALRSEAPHSEARGAQ